MATFLLRRGCFTSLGLPFFDPLVFLYRFGGDGRGRLRFRGVVLLNVGGGGGDSAPGFTATDANHDSTHDNGTN